jgi:predicted DNA-binding transcriptional regulator YafY
MAWHLVGYCRFRNDYRDFRLDRITRLTLGNENFVSREIKSVREFFKRNLSDCELEQITIRFPKTQSALIQTIRYYYGYIGEEEAGDKVDLNFISADLEYFCRWLLMYADIVEIISNEKLRQRFMNHVKTIKKRFA